MVDTKDDTPLAKKIQDYVAKTVGKTSAEYACLGIESILPSATTEGGINAEGLADEICDFYRVTSKYVGEEGYKSSKEYWVKTIKRHLSHTKGGELKQDAENNKKVEHLIEMLEKTYNETTDVFGYGIVLYNAGVSRGNATMVGRVDLQEKAQEIRDNVYRKLLEKFPRAGTGGVDRESISENEIYDKLQKMIDEPTEEALKIIARYKEGVRNEVIDEVKEFIKREYVGRRLINFLDIGRALEGLKSKGKATTDTQK